MKTRLRVWAALGLVALFAAPAYAGISVPFKGVRQVHLRYSFFWEDPPENMVRIELARFENDEKRKVLIQDSSTSFSFNGDIRDDALTWDHEYTYRWVPVDDEGNEGNLDHLFPPVTVTLNEIGGTLLFDTTLAPAPIATTPLAGVIIPEGLSLTLAAGETYGGDEGLMARGALHVGANVTFAEARFLHVEGMYHAPQTADMSLVTVWLWMPVSLDDPTTPAEFQFMPAAEGSSISGGCGLRIVGDFPDLTITDSKALDLVFSGTDYRLTLDNCELASLESSWGYEMPPIPAGGRLEMTSTTVNFGMPPAAYFHFEGEGELLCDNCVFTNCATVSMPSERASFNDCVFMNALVDSSATFDDCQFDHLRIETLYPDRPVFDGCRILYGVEGKPWAPFDLDECVLIGGLILNKGAAGESPTITDCEIFGTIYVYYRTDAEFTGNKIFAEMNFGITDSDWATETFPSPTIRDNYFLGRRALYYFLEFFGDPPSEPIPIGPNYYGDPLGPRRVDYTDWGDGSPKFLGNHGAMVCDRFENYGHRFFALEPPLDDATNPLGPDDFPQDDDAPHDVWLHAYIVGQETLPHDDPGPDGNIMMLQCKETLLSLDVVCLDHTLADVEFWLEVDGEAGEPLQHTLHRCRSSYYPGEIVAGKATVNFIIPTVEKANVPIKVMMDTTPALDDDGDVTAILERTLDYHAGAPTGDKYHIRLQPVKMNVPSRTSSEPNAVAFGLKLPPLFGGMMPVRSEEIRLSRRATYTYRKTLSVGGVLPKFSNFVILNAIALEIKMKELFKRIARGGADPDPPDITVVVLADGALNPGGASADNRGAHIGFHNSLIFVDEARPNATLHELGHSLGLYTGKEQYDLEKPDGIPVRDMTVFVSQPLTISSDYPDQSQRFWHCGAKEDFWGSAVPHMTDVMGSARHVWPIPDTMFNFSALFLDLYNTGAPKAEEAQAARDAEPREPVGLDAGERRLMVRAWQEIESQTVYGPIWRIQPETIRTFDATSFAQDVSDYGVYWPAPGEEGSMRYLMRAVTPGGDDDQPFDLLNNDGTVYHEVNLLFATFDIPDTATRVEIWKNLGGEPTERLFAVDLAPAAPVTTITSPAPGADVTDGLAVEWSSVESRAAKANRARLVEQQIATQPLQHMVLARVGDGDWTPLSMFDEGGSIEIGADFLMPGQTADVRVMSSGGLGPIADTQADDLTVSDRPPRVEILAPQDGDQAAPGHEWRLAATATDLEDGDIAAGVWSSSRDGDLGTSTTIDGVVLSEGAHRLSFATSDTTGLTGEARVDVTVAPFDGVDLALADDALDISTEGEDPLTQGGESLTVGTTHTLALSMRNVGTPTTATLSLYVTPPGGAEALVASDERVLAPFEDSRLEGAFIPTADGVHAIRGAIESVDPTDNDTANNEQTWRRSTGGFEALLLDYLLGISKTPEASFDCNNDGRLDMSDVILFSAEFLD